MDAHRTRPISNRRAAVRTRWIAALALAVAAGAGAIAFWPRRAADTSPGPPVPGPPGSASGGLRATGAEALPAPPSTSQSGSAPSTAAAAKAPPTPLPRAEALSEGERRRMLVRVASAMGVIPRSFRTAPAPEALEEVREAIELARELVRRAPGSPEAHRARYFAFRYLEVLGHAEEAEREFEAYLGEVAAAEGVAAACKLLEKEGLREERARSFTLALKRFQAMLAFGGREGETAAIAHARMANVYARQHLGDLAIQARLKAIALGAPVSEERDCRRYLLRVYLANRQYGEALRHGKALVALPGNEAQKANDEARLGMVIEKTEGPLKAAALYRQILAKYPERFCSIAKWRLREIEEQIENAVLDPNP